MERAELVANKYAEGFFNAAKDAGVVEEAYPQIELFCALLNTFEGLARWLDSPVLTYEEKIVFLEGICDGFSFMPITKAFLALLVRNKRVEIFPLIYRAVRGKYNAYRGYVDVEIITARPLREDERQLFLHIWGAFIRSYLDVKEIVDPSIIAGMIVKYRGKKYDASMVRALAQLKEAMLQ